MAPKRWIVLDRALRRFLRWQHRTLLVTRFKPHPTA